VSGNEGSVQSKLEQARQQAARTVSKTVLSRTDAEHLSVWSALEKSIQPK
tara:strand:- start:245 stop:394 length:150 start_codon:yes stop_codon:yes gene_type:complete